MKWGCSEKREHEDRQDKDKTQYCAGTTEQGGKVALLGIFKKTEWNRKISSSSNILTNQ